MGNDMPSCCGFLLMANVVTSHIQSGLENFQGWILQNFSEHHYLTVLIAKSFFLYLVLLFQFMPVITHPLAKHCCEEPDSSLLENIPVNSGHCCRVPCRHLFSRLDLAHTLCLQSNCSSSDHLGGFY